MITKQGQQNRAGGGDTDAIQVHRNDVPRELYHTDWVADRTIAYLDSLPDDSDWFVWMSFPDPHHPWDPPASELSRVDWRDVPLPHGYPGSPEAAASAAVGLFGPDTFQYAKPSLSTAILRTSDPDSRWRSS